jgi:hypothetical protein
VEPVEINGEPPQLDGLRCDAILCQEHWHGGALVEPANVTFLCFEGRWHRLYFDFGIVFWRDTEGGPEPFEASEIDSNYPVVDVATERGLRGVKLRGYRMEPWGDCGAMVAFEFESGARLAFRSVEDVTPYDDA